MLILLASTLFLSAFLLFCSEPMVGKMVLPILGGAASVWTTCVLFFQLMLLAGYVYTHLLGKLKRVQQQILVHLPLMLLAIVFLPIRFSHGSGNPSEAPVSWLLQHLLISVGLPFAVISATAPLLQNWLAKTPAASGRDPYFLYATSNAGSLLALIAYPALVEPRYGVAAQSSLWLRGYGVLVAMVAFAAVLIWRESRFVKKEQDSVVDEPVPVAPTWRTRTFWLGASFVPSALMLAVTNHISLNIGSVPFLWIVPLAVYLLTFIMAFARKIRFSTKIVSAAATLALLVLFPIAAVGVPVSTGAIWYLMGAHIAILFFGALLCHSALADSRPSTKYLTEFYFMIALGGVLSGVFAAIIAPGLFRTVFEYPLLVAMIVLFRVSNEQDQRINWRDAAWLVPFGALVAAGLYSVLKWAQIDVTAFSISWDYWKDDLKAPENLAVLGVEATLVLGALFFRKRIGRFALAFSILILTYAIILPPEFEGASRIYVARDFFGVKKVLFDLDTNMRKLVHGDTMHGVESLDITLAGQPLSYYHKTGPIGDLMTMVSSRPNQRIGVVGLGTGTIAAYGNATRRITFFDVDPQVVDIAQGFFTFYRRCGESCDVVIGDGRLSILAQPDRTFDLLILDAFNSDSIPGHLVSVEAVHMYMSKLKPDGVLLFHVSNRYLDVEKLASAVSLDAGLVAFVRHDNDEGPTGKASSDYVAAVNNEDDIRDIPHGDEWIRVERPTDLRGWTDDYSNMMSIIRW